MIDAMPTEDGRIPLPPGSVIIGADNSQYTIQPGDVGYGGSALIYRVSRAGNLRNFIIKECYPRSDDKSFIRNENGIVCPKNIDDPKVVAQWNMLRENFLREEAIGQEISRKSDRIVAAWENLQAVKIKFGDKTFDTAGSFFIVMEQAQKDNAENAGWFLGELLTECAKPDDKNFPLRTGSLPAPYVVVCIIEELLKSLRDIHKASYVHADIHDNNFFLSGNDLGSGDIGVGKLLDFGNARKLNDNGKTDEIPAEQIFTTRGYCSPEIFFAKLRGGTVILTPATDVFSAGCLMLYLLCGFDYRNRWGDELVKNLRISKASVFFSLEDAMERGFRSNAANLAVNILSSALEFKPERRYKNAEEMLKAIVELKKLSAPSKFQLAPNMSKSPTPYWVEHSRDTELADLKRDFKSGRNPCFVWGLAGVGKTTLAMKFAASLPGESYFVTFCGTIKETVLRMDFANYVFQPGGTGNPQDQEFRERMEILKTDYADSLLIIDNFEREGTDLAELQREPAYKELIGSGLRILFTTRSRPDQITPELGSLSEEDAFALFITITKDDSDGKKKIELSPEDEGLVRELLREIEYHPLTVELSARAVCDSWETVTPQELLKNFKTGKFRTGKRSEKIYEQLRILFRLYQFDESYRQILSHVTLLPLDGIDAALILKTEDDKKKQQLKAIEARGFVRRRKDDNRLRIHPLIRSIIKNEIKPTDKDCDQFLTALWKNLEHQYPPDVTNNRQAAELYFKAILYLMDERGLNSPCGRYFYYEGACTVVAGSTAVGFVYIKRAIESREGTPADYELAKMYLDAGIANVNVLCDDDALNFLQTALKILNETAPQSTEVAETFASIGLFYLNHGNYTEAVRHAELALDFIQRYPPPPNRKVSLSFVHRILGIALLRNNQPFDAVKHLKIATDILKSILPAAGHPDLAISYLELAKAYSDAKIFDSAIDFANKAIALQEKLLSDGHGKIAAAYFSVAEIYDLAGQFIPRSDYQNKARMYEQKASAIMETLSRQNSIRLLEQEKILIEQMIKSGDTSMLAFRYQSVAGDYMSLKDFANAEKYIELALNSLGEENFDSSNKINTYQTASQICYAQGNFEGALTYALRTLNVIETLQPKNFFHMLGAEYSNIGNIFRNMRKFDDAINFFKKSVEAELKCPNPDYGTIKFLETIIEGTLRDKNQK